MVTLRRMFCKAGVQAMEERRTDLPVSLSRETAASHLSAPKPHLLRFVRTPHSVLHRLLASYRRARRPEPALIAKKIHHHNPTFSSLDEILSRLHAIDLVKASVIALHRPRNINIER